MNPFTLDKSIPRAVKMLQNMVNPKYIGQDKAIPLTLLRHCEGVAFIRIYKAGLFMLGGNIGGGCIISKIKDPNEETGYRWSAPVAVVCGGLGGGFVFGGEQSAVRAFTGKGQITFGGNVSLAVGPVGRELEAHVGASDNREIVAAYSYSQAKGAYIGGTLEGAILFVKDEENKKFYENPNATAEALLSGAIRPPFRAQSLGNELTMVLTKKGEYARIESGVSIGTQRSRSELAASGRELVKRGLSSSSLESDLPAGWESATAPDGKTYYYNASTGVTQWEKPAPVAVAVPAPPPVAPIAAAAAAAARAPVASASPARVPVATSAPAAGRPPIPTRPTIPARPSQQTAVALYDYTASQSDELTIKAGDKIEILEKLDANWWKGRLAGRVGLVPVTYLKQQ